MRSKLRVLLVMFVLFGLPIGSYYYLTKGYQFRKEALVQLQPKGHFDLSGLKRLNSKEFAKDLQNRVLLVMPVFNQTDLERKWTVFENIFNQFGGNRALNFLFCVPEEMELSYIEDERYRGLVFSDTACKSDAEEFLLVDGSQNIRGRYTMKPSDLQELVKHIAILMPIKKHQEAELIRKKTN